MSERKNVLHVENVTMQFGGVVAMNNLSLDVMEGEIVALIGPNGAGKTTAFNCITGVYEPTNGKIDFGVPYQSVIAFDVKAYEPEECPLCKEGKLPVVKPGSRTQAK